MATVTMTMEEYLQLLNGLSGEPQTDSVEVAPVQARKRRRRRNPKLKRALIEANKRLRTKSGKLRKGKTQADVMRLAHKLVKKMK